MVLIAASFGEAGENRADLNGDGVVNVQDLVLVANAFANIAGAPSAHASLSAAQVEQWLRLSERARFWNTSMVLFIFQYFDPLVRSRETIHCPSTHIQNMRFIARLQTHARVVEDY